MEGRGVSCGDFPLGDSFFHMGMVLRVEEGSLVVFIFQGYW